MFNKKDGKRLAALVVSFAKEAACPYATVTLDDEQFVKAISFGMMSFADGARLATEGQDAGIFKEDYVLARLFYDDELPSGIPEEFSHWDDALMKCAKAYQKGLLQLGVTANFDESPAGTAPIDADADWFIEAGRAIGVDTFVDAALAGVPLEYLFA